MRFAARLVIDPAAVTEITMAIGGVNGYEPRLPGSPLAGAHERERSAEAHLAPAGFLRLEQRPELDFPSPSVPARNRQRGGTSCPGGLETRRRSCFLAIFFFSQ